MLGDLGNGGNGAWSVDGFSLTHGVVAPENDEVEIDIEEQIVLILGIGLENPRFQGGVELYHEISPLGAGKQLVNPGRLGVKGQEQFLGECSCTVKYHKKIMSN